MQTGVQVFPQGLVGRGDVISRHANEGGESDRHGPGS